MDMKPEADSTTTSKSEDKEEKGIHIGEPSGRPYLGPGPLDMEIVKEERDMGPSYMDTMDSMHGLHHYSGMTPPPLGHTSPIMGPGGPGRARKNKEDKICGVCGDRALGYNFDAISCESCKAFFRRNAPKGLDYFKCPYDEKCKMDISNRRFCKRCRLRKCFEIGMRKEYILTEEEKARKRQKIEDNRRLRAAQTPGPQVPGGPPNSQCQSQSSPSTNNSMMNSPDGISPGGSTGEGSPYFDDTSNMDGYVLPQQTPTSFPTLEHHTSSKIDQNESSMMSHGGNSWDGWPQGEPAYNQGLMNNMEHNGICERERRVLSPEEQVLIEELLYAYQGSLEINMEKVINREEADSMADLVNIAEISVRRVIDMAKKVKAFKSLPQADQISLLKGGSIELLILRSVITFDKEKQHFLDPCDSEESAAMNLDQLRRAEGTTLFEDHMKFVTQLAVDLKADQTTLILLLIISLFSPDRPNLLNKQLVGEEQHRYSMLLSNYLESRYSYHEARALYPKLLMKLTDIRNLNEEHSQVLLKVNPMVIQPLMQEVLDLRA